MFKKSSLWMLCVLVCAVAFAGQRGPESVAVEYLQRNLEQMQLSQADLDEYVVSDLYSSQSTGLTHLYLNQTHDGILVFNGILGMHIDANDQVVYTTNRWVRDLAQRISNPVPVLSAEDAILHMTDALNLIDALPPRRTEAQGRNQDQVFEGGQLSLRDIQVNLVYVPSKGGVRLGWRVNIQPAASQDWWDMVIDAESGAVIAQINWTVYDRFDPRGAVRSGRSTQKQVAPPKTSQKGGPSYLALPLPLVSPDEGMFEAIVDPADVTASPFGWHDTNGVAGPEFTTTQGNNVHAYQDRDGNDTPSGGDPDGGGSLIFNFSADLNQVPNTYTPAATVNLFVWNNLIHDITYHYGFDEAAGNFQERNYSGQGLGVDSVNAQSQSGADANPPTLNNANFSTPTDGSHPRMRMFEWTEAATASMTVNSPGTIAGTYIVNGASFGSAFPALPGVTYDLELVNDGTGTATDACEPLIGFTAGRVAVIDRGSCEFGVKALNAQNAGATAVVVVNNSPHGTTSMGPGAVGSQVTIPAVMINLANGNAIKAELAGGVNATFSGTTPSLPNRDSDFDNGIIAHEYGHGVSNRLTGGPNNTSCLGNQEQMGEGWSDFLAFALTAKPGDTGEGPLGVGTYVSYQPTNGIGIRPYPYSNDMSVNPFVYADIAFVPVPHGVGSVWCTMLWDLYWALVDRDGFDPDVYNGTGGNNLAIQLVLDGMKLQACSPGFVDGRNGILAADAALTGGANACLIWNVFARRGLGVDANQGDTNSVLDSVMDFTSMPGCCLNAVITASSKSVMACEGDSVTLTVTATGSDLTYQWQQSEVNIPGATSASYTIDSLDMSSVGSYTCVVSNTCSTETSGAADVDLVPPLVFDNSVLSSWLAVYPEPACDDINANGTYDVLDFVNAVVAE